MTGFCQEFRILPELAVYLYTHLQLECIKETKYEDRILHVDATGSLVDVPEKHTRDSHKGYKRILNYFCLLKNGANLSQRGLLLSELLSSAHDSCSLAKFFFAMRLDYAKVCRGEELRFRLVVIDYSWALIHSLLSNLISIIVKT